MSDLIPSKIISGKRYQRLLENCTNAGQLFIMIIAVGDRRLAPGTSDLAQPHPVGA
jgi:hypothetical protein